MANDGSYTVDGSEIRRSPVEVGSFSHHLQGFIHPKWLAGFLNHQQYLPHLLHFFFGDLVVGWGVSMVSPRPTKKLVRFKKQDVNFQNKAALFWVPRSELKEKQQKTQSHRIHGTGIFIFT